MARPGTEIPNQNGFSCKMGNCTSACGHLLTKNDMEGKQNRRKHSEVPLVKPKLARRTWYKGVNNGLGDRVRVLSPRLLGRSLEKPPFFNGE